MRAMRTQLATSAEVPGLSRQMERVGDPEAALSAVLAWVRDVTEDSPALGPISGINDSELTQLARLGGLILDRLGEDVPDSLLAALTPTDVIDVERSAQTAFDRLLEEDAVVHLADLYAAVVTPPKRRPLGTFFTPREYAQAIVDGFASRHDAPDEVIDVGAGVGIFSEIARTMWPNASIHAIDINPLTLGLQAVVAAKFPDWNVRLVLADYRRWLDSNVPTTPTLYLGNPPYTRWQLLDPDTRADLLEAADGLVGTRANLSTLFLAMTLARLRPQDSLAMIIPAGWMRADYGRKLRERLRGEGHRRISLRLADSWRFDRAIVDAVLVEVGPKSARDQQIEVSDWSGSERLVVSRADGEAAFSAPGRSHLDLSSREHQGSPLAQYARLTRGTASGANSFFIKTPAEWDSLGIPVRFRRSLARRLRPGLDPSEPSLEKAEILVLEGYSPGAVGRVDEWIAEAEAEELHERHLCSTRARWFDLSSELKTPDVIVSALARETFHVLENSDNLAILNNLFGLYWNPETTMEAKNTVLSWLRSREGQSVLRSSSSLEANGLHRLSPKAMGKLLINTPFPLATGAGASGLVISGGGST